MIENKLLEELRKYKASCSRLIAENEQLRQTINLIKGDRLRLTDKTMIKFRDAWRTQRHMARYRGIEFLLTFEEWLNIWLDSGFLHLRGSGAGKYCMGRNGDTGPYEVGNVKIIPHEENVYYGNIGRAMPIEIRLKISMKSKGRKHTPESILRMSEIKKGKKHTPETKAKISAINKGKILSAETRNRMSVASALKAPASQEWRDKVSAKLKNRWAGRKAQGLSRL